MQLPCADSFWCIGVIFWRCGYEILLRKPRSRRVLQECLCHGTCSPPPWRIFQPWRRHTKEHVGCDLKASLALPLSTASWIHQSTVDLVLSRGRFYEGFFLIGSQLSAREHFVEQHTKILFSLETWSALAMVQSDHITCEEKLGEGKKIAGQLHRCQCFCWGRMFLTWEFAVSCERLCLRVSSGVSWKLVKRWKVSWELVERLVES